MLRTLLSASVRRLLILVTACLVLSARSASSAPITLTYEGNWAYYNLGSTCCYEFALETGFGQHGIVSVGRTVLGDHAQGTLFTFSMTINPNASIGPIFGGLGYVGGVTAATLLVGPLTYTVQPGSNLKSDGRLAISPVFGPSITGTDGLTLFPDWMDFLDLGPPTTFTIGNVTVWQNPTMMFSFAPRGVGGIGLAPNAAVLSELRLVSVSVPEPSSMVVVSGAIIALGLHRFRQRRRNTSKQHN